MTGHKVLSQRVEDLVPDKEWPAILLGFLQGKKVLNDHRQCLAEHRQPVPFLLQSQGFADQETKELACQHRWKAVATMPLSETTRDSAGSGCPRPAVLQRVSKGLCLNETSPKTGLDLA